MAENRPAKNKILILSSNEEKCDVQSVEIAFGEIRYLCLISQEITKEETTLKS
jgi:hypothetical protein